MNEEISKNQTDAEFREVLWAFTALMIAIAITAHALPGTVQPYVYSFILAAMVYLPLWRSEVHRRPLADYGIHLRHAGKEAAFAGLWMAIVFPPFLLGNHIWHVGLLGDSVGFIWPKTTMEVFGNVSWLTEFVGLGAVSKSSLVWIGPFSIFWAFVEQAILIGLPEEFFYRGWMQSVFSRRWTNGFVIWGVPIGLTVILTSVLFAIGHLASVPSLFRLAVFFPSILFCWMRAKRGSIVAPLLFHGASNVVMTFSNAFYH